MNASVMELAQVPSASLAAQDELVGKLMQACRRKSLDAIQEVHPSRLHEVLEQVGLGAAWRGELETPAGQALVRHALSLHWPGLEAFAALHWRLALLPRRVLCQALAAIGLHADRARVRLTLSGTVRSALVSAVSERVYLLMLRERAPHRAGSGALSEAEAQADTLARKGLGVLVGAAAAGAPDVLNPWIRSALPAAATQPTLLSPAPGEITALADFHILSHYFPEYQWLFGSALEKTLSAAKTV